VTLAKYFWLSSQCFRLAKPFRRHDFIKSHVHSPSVHTVGKKNEMCSADEGYFLEGSEGREQEWELGAWWCILIS
jgi:hypothetical protein